MKILLYSLSKTNKTHMYFHWPGALPCFKKKSMYSFYYITTYRRKNHRIKEILKIPGGEHFNQTKTWKTVQKCIFAIFALQTPLPCGLSNFNRTFKIPTSIFGSKTFLEKPTWWLGSSFRRKTWTFKCRWVR